MPLFEYACKACNHVFEKLIRAGDAAPTCGACGSADLEKLLSQVTVSSEHSRATNLKDGHARVGKQRHDINVANAEYHAKHTHDDH